MADKSKTAQLLVNSYPPNSDIRSSEQSLGFQLLNTIGHQYDDLREQLRKITDNMYIGTAVVSDIDVYESVKLPDSYVFTKADDDDTELLYTPPTVSGLIGTTYYPITLAGDNTVEDFWYKSLPSRLEIETSVSGIDFLLASGMVGQSPLQVLTVSGLIQTPNQLTVTISGGNSYIGLSEDKFIRRSMVQIEGKNRAGKDITEELYFIYDETIKTTYEYQSLEEVRVYGVKPASAFITVKSNAFNEIDYLANYSELYQTVSRQPMIPFWGIDNGLVGQKTLAFKTYLTDDIEIRLNGFTQKQNLIEIDLVDSEDDYPDILDITVEPYSNRIWAVNNNKLYIYSSNLPYPNTKLLDKKQYDANSIIELNNYYLSLGKSVDVSYIWRRPIVGLIKHRVSVKKPDNTIYSIEDGVEVTFHTNESSWIFGEPKERNIRPTDTFVPNQYGDYVYTLECIYTDGSSSIDQKILSVVKRAPLAEYNLTINNAVGIDFDSESKLWILDTLGRKHLIKRYFDNMIIDFNKKIIYLKDRYDKVRIF